MSAETINATHKSSIGRGSAASVGNSITRLMQAFDSYSLVIKSLSFTSDEITVEFYESELAGAALKQRAFTPEIPIERWATHFLGSCVVAAETRLAHER